MAPLDNPAWICRGNFRVRDIIAMRHPAQYLWLHEQKIYILRSQFRKLQIRLGQWVHRKVNFCINLRALAMSFRS
jgi:hypothetical protein